MYIIFLKVETEFIDASWNIPDHNLALMSHVSQKRHPALKLVSSACGQICA